MTRIMKDRPVAVRKNWLSLLASIVMVLGLVFPATQSVAQLEYSFRPLAFLGDPAPGGGVFAADFEPFGLNDRSEAVFVADLSPAAGEGIFLARNGQLSQIVRVGQDAPGGGTFASFDLGRSALNANGDVSLAFTLEPFNFPSEPLGINSGVYRFSQNTNTVTPVLVPGVTPAPGGGTFAGTFFNTSINNRGDIVFGGMVPATIGPGAPIGLGIGLFQTDEKDHITKVVGPGDPAPGGHTFDFAYNGWINNGGDIAFGAHVKEDECLDLGQTLPSFIFCAESVYLKDAATGQTKSIAHQGAPAPGGGTYRLAFGPVLNNQGEIAFVGDLTPAPGFGENLAVFLHTRGNTVPVARPGDSMPGGGSLLRASFFALDFHLNNHGEVAFSGVLDTSSDAVNNDTGLYVFSHGSLRLVARTGTVISDVGTIARLGSPNFPLPSSGAANNDRGQVLFHATLTDGKTVLLLATPSKE
jgi:hypothetical protein